MSEPDVRQVLVHPVVWPHLELWLAGRGLVLARVPVEDDLPTYAMTLAGPGDAEKVIRDAARQAAGQTTHAAPHPDSGLTACCRKTPFELPHTDLMTTQPETVTCRQAAGQPAAAAETGCPAALMPFGKHLADPCVMRGFHVTHRSSTGRAWETEQSAAGQPDTQQQPQLTAAERQFLTFALDLAADHMANRGNEFDEDDEAALARLRRMTDEAVPVVAYRDPRNPRVLLCRDHGRKWHGVVPLTADDLPDGGICVFGRLSSFECGRDVLADEAARRHDRKAGR